MADADDVLERKVAELAGRRFADLERIVEKPELWRETLDGVSFVGEVQGRKMGRSIHLMVECARDLPLLRSFGRAVYIAIAPDGTLTRNSEPW